MIMPSQEILRLHEIIENGNKEEQEQARKILDEVLQKEQEERKNNPPLYNIEF